MSLMHGHHGEAMVARADHQPAGQSQRPETSSKGRPETETFSAVRLLFSNFPLLLQREPRSVPASGISQPISLRSPRKMTSVLIEQAIEALRTPGSAKGVSRNAIKVGLFFLLGLAPKQRSSANVGTDAAAAFRRAAGLPGCLFAAGCKPDLVSAWLPACLQLAACIFAHKTARSPSFGSPPRHTLATRPPPRASTCP
jgi:hypothetical protein